MPSDRKGEPVRVGDFVMIPAVVTEIHSQDEFINVVMETMDPMYPARHKTQIILNAHQIEVVHPSVAVLVVRESAAEDVLKTPTPESEH